MDSSFRPSCSRSAVASEGRAGSEAASESRSERAVSLYRHERKHRKVACSTVSRKPETLLEQRLQHSLQVWLRRRRSGLADHVKSGGGQPAWTVDDLEVLNSVGQPKQELEGGIRDTDAALSALGYRLTNMSDRSSTRTVYSTGTGGLCPKCGWPMRQCPCSERSPRDERLPARIVAKLRIEKAGRGGKTVTVVYDLPRNQPFLKELATELKRACGAGGAVVGNTVEIQGDLRERIRAALEKKGWMVKG